MLLQTFDPNLFHIPPSQSSSGPDAVAIFAALALLVDLLFVLVVVKEAAERGANPALWGVITLVLPFLGYAIWKASVSQEDHPADMSILTRELERRRPAGPAPPAAPLSLPRPAPSPPRRRPRNFF